MPNLYKIETEIQALIENIRACYNPETGELENQLELNKLITKFRNKNSDKEKAIEGILSSILEEEALIQSRKDIIERQRKEIRYSQNRIQRKKDFLSAVIPINEKIKTLYGTVGWSKSDTLEIAPYAIVPDQFYKTKVEKVLDKNILKNAIKSGNVSIYGVYLKQYSLSIRKAGGGNAQIEEEVS